MQIDSDARPLGRLTWACEGVTIVLIRTMAENERIISAAWLIGWIAKIEAVVRRMCIGGGISDIRFAHLQMTPI